MKILESNKTHIIYKEDNGVVSIVPSTPYFNMKVIECKNERIKFDIPIEGIEIIETFNGMIFNISLNGQTITTRPNMADAVVEAFTDTDKIYKIFDDYNNNKYNLKLLQGVLEKYGERIRTVPEGFVIDDIFLIDRTGVCWLWDNKLKQRNTSHRTNLGSGAVCIVVDKTQRLKLKTSGGLVEIDEMGYIILSKIDFIMNPNLEDNVFMHQLPIKIQTILKRNKELYK
ncbi:hypothetical protein N9998_00350 [Nitrosopumilus sp.]|nr:hypothetical protein [Nitrosopumilus sp.]